MNKICTSIEQSRKLIELGIDIKTSDMYYYTVNGDWEWYETPNIRESIDDLNEHTIPAWSLSALLSLIKPYDNETYTMRGTLDGGAIIGFRHITNVMYQEDNPLDAVFEMVCWLKKEEYI